MPILYASAFKAKRAYHVAGASPIAIQRSSIFFCPWCGEGNLYDDVPCAGCGEVLPMRKAS